MSDGWQGLGKFKRIKDGDEEKAKAAADAILSLEVDEDDGVDRAQLLQALKVAQAALRGERTRTQRTEKDLREAKKSGGGGGGGGASSDALAKAKAETQRLNELLRQTKEELDAARDEADDLTDQLEAKERSLGGRGGTRISLSATGAAAGQERLKNAELDAEVRKVKSQLRELRSEAQRKDELIDARAATIEKLKLERQDEQKELADLRDEGRVLRAQVRDYREKLDNNNDAVINRGREKSESEKRLRQRTREYNNMLDTNAKLQLELKERG